MCVDVLDVRCTQQAGACARDAAAVEAARTQRSALTIAAVSAPCDRMYDEVRAL